MLSIKYDPELLDSKIRENVEYLLMCDRRRWPESEREYSVFYQSYVFRWAYFLSHTIGDEFYNKEK